MSSTRPLRADARRNYERLLAEARAVFGESGIDASLEEIARRAGVGIGTLYRHFPSREVLLEALLGARFDAQAEAAEALLGEDDPLAALRTFARGMLGTATTFRGLSAATADALNDETSDLHRACRGMRSAAARLVARAQESGQLRADLAPDEVLLMVHAAGWASEHAGDPDRLLDLVFAGLCSR
ncbi:TetR/AcrR family transcriptional regulator [Amycolatopsis granulosa]|uniref:TetR/AcrR family transcriptional regulator n=1 Tax=Amycolatopsis granulosa TaxID=185684 RepID=UPI00141F54F6|nr:TetR/AcrR family transcriptional regulator [Amycolatopsis granulosa]NIH84954.1 AcrR family transcriptional regulator [Amycolatopsis granulosa]